jgi:hypothetical protein
MSLAAFLKRLERVEAALNLAPDDPAEHEAQLASLLDESDVVHERLAGTPGPTVALIVDMSDPIFSMMFAPLDD